MTFGRGDQLTFISFREHKILIRNFNVDQKFDLLKTIKE